LYNTGKSPEEAGEQLAKLQKEEVELDEALKKGAKVEVSHKGKRTQGTVVRYVPQRGAASPYYVVYVGEYGSIEVPAHKIKEEVELDEANYEIKNGKVHISKKEFAKVSKDYKGKDTMTVLDPKTGATVNMPVVFEEVELDEGKFQVKTASSKKGKITVTDFDSLDDAKKHLAAMEKKGQRGIISQDGKLVKEEVELDEGRYAVTFQKGTRVGARSFLTNRVQAKDEDDAIKKAEAGKGEGPKIEKGYKFSSIRKEEVELDEGKTEKDILIALKKEKLGGYFSGGTLYVAQRVLETVRDLLKDMKLKSMPKLVGEEVKKEARQLKDPKKEVMVVKGGKVIVINKKDAKEYLNKGWELAEKVDESSRSDALKAMRGDPVLGKRDKKELETDIAATADDKKAASKNIIYQLMQVLALKGSGELRLTPSKKKEKGDYSKTKGSAYVEFSGGKKEKVDRKIAREILSKYVSLQKPIDKQKFQAKIAKSYKDMLAALKESFKEEVVKEGTWALPDTPKQKAALKKLLSKPLKAKDASDKLYDLIGDDEMADDLDDYAEREPNDDVRPMVKSHMKRLGIKEEVELDEGRMSQLHAYIKDGKDAKWIAKKMGIDVKTVQSFIDDFDESLGEHKNKILNRIGQKIREKKNG